MIDVNFQDFDFIHSSLFISLPLTTLLLPVFTFSMSQAQKLKTKNKNIKNKWLSMALNVYVLNFFNLYVRWIEAHIIAVTILGTTLFCHHPLTLSQSLQVL